MSAADLAAIVVTVCAVAAVTGLLITMISLRSTLHDLREAARVLTDEAVPALTSLRVTLDRADDDLDRLDGLLGTAEAVSSTVESASRVTQAAVTNPAIKAAAFLSGARRTAGRLRGKRAQADVGSAGGSP